MGHDPPDVGERGRQARLRERHPLDDAPGPGRPSSWVRSATRKRPRWRSARYDRPPGVLDAAHEFLDRSIPRLMDLGVLPDIMAGNIIGVIAQRLMRKLCSQCKSPTNPDPRHAAPARHGRRRQPSRLPGSRMRALRQHGLQGRVAIMELFKMDAEIDELIARRATSRGDPRLRHEQGLPHARRRCGGARAARADEP